MEQGMYCRDYSLWLHFFTFPSYQACLQVWLALFKQINVDRYSQIWFKYFDRWVNIDRPTTYIPTLRDLDLGENINNFNPTGREYHCE